VCGWGEPIVEGRADTVRAAVEEMSDTSSAKRQATSKTSGRCCIAVASIAAGRADERHLGIEQALWDIKGKQLGVPVYELLGGPVRDKMRVYAWIGSDKPQQVAETARERCMAGYTAIKMNGTPELEWIDSSIKIHEAIERVGMVARRGGACVWASA
jgi:galactonate dehydratase